MLDRYRFKIKGNKIIGPFDLGEVKKIIDKGRLDKFDEVQEFPSGDWLSISDLSVIFELFERDLTKQQDETFIANLKDLKLELDGEDKDVEPTADTPIIGVEEDNDTVMPIDEFVEYPVDAKASTSTIKKKDTGKSQGDTTLKKAKTVELDDDKTKINPDYQKYLQEQKEEERRLKEQEKIEKIIEEEEAPPDYENEATQMLSIDDLSKNYTDTIELEQFQEGEKTEVKQLSDHKKTSAKKKKLAKKPKSNKKQDQKKIIYIALGVLLVIFLLFDSEESDPSKLKKIKLVSPQIKFPSRYDIEDSNLAREFYKNGLIEMRKHTYISYIRASKMFSTSAENKFNDNPAMAKLIFLYANNLRNSDEFGADANAVFRLVQIFKLKGFTDPNFASAISYFYYSIDKIEASLKTFDKYMTLNQKKATMELFAVRLLALIKGGYLDKAKVMADKLFVQKNKDHFILKALYNYYKAEERTEQMNTILVEANKLYPNSIYFLLEKGFNSMEIGEYKKIKKVIFRLNRLNVGGSKYDYSRYLVLKGMYHAYKKQVGAATSDFKTSLKLFESTDLIEKLSDLDQVADNDTNTLIKRSKAKKLIKLGKAKLAVGNIRSAFRYGLEASSIAPEMLQVRIFLAKLQMKRGYIDDAIKQLESLFRDNPSSLDLLFTLIDAYTEAYKFKKVVSLLGAAQNMITANDDRFYAAKAKFSSYQGDFNSGVGWLERAVAANPLNDKNIYELAKLYIKFHKYPRSKQKLKLAFDLDPSSVKYKILFASILYEVENADAAIGYLYNVLQDFKDNPQILGEIGIYFHRSGQIKKYSDIREKLLLLPEKDETLFSFLIEAAKIDDDVQKVVENSEKLLEINPGDLRIRIELADIYINLQSYKKAKYHLDVIGKRLSTYPKLQYLRAKLYYLIDDINTAKPLVESEIRENPTVIDGYLLLADIYIKEKNLTAARKQFLKAARLDGDNVDAILGIAFVAFHSDQYDMALDQYQKAIELDPSRAEVYKLLGDASKKLGQSQIAIKNYKLYLELSPNTQYKSTIQKYINTME